jgi:hypothetical protein
VFFYIRYLIGSISSSGENLAVPFIDEYQYRGDRKNPYNEKVGCLIVIPPTIHPFHLEIVFQNWENRDLGSAEGKYRNEGTMP